MLTTLESRRGSIACLGSLLEALYGGVHRIEGNASSNPGIYIPGWPSLPFGAVRRIDFE